ncbi:mitochondrial carrier domain-containing protein [Xylariomycetidae sp. FL0641]|nr:mitochondrial carrier domain-containing protein [Xylariomycetidae sp. FL0641]
MSQPQPTFSTALLAGGIAGTTVDLSLYPLDTLKTRLQSSSGFLASGGFRGVYRGVGSALVGSAPGAAFFFCTYEGVKSYMSSHRSSVLGSAGAGGSGAVDHMLAATLGEVAACAVRVPTEVVKQRAQAGQHGGSSWASLRAILAHPYPGHSPLHRFTNIWLELYRGWGITVLREVPFTVIQFPLWEALKAWGRRRRGGGPAMEVGAVESALYGSVSGAVAAGITTPLDVLKTRVMLSRERAGVLSVLRALLRDHGVRPFFAGIGPRVAWISAGGAIFLGSYQWAVNALEGNIV